MSKTNLLSDQADLNKFTNNEVNKENDSVDLVERTIGSFGRWQLKTCFLMCLLKSLVTWYEMSIIYLNPSTQFRCKLPPTLNNSNNSSYGPINEEFNSTNIKVEDDSCYLTFEFSQNSSITTPCVWGYDYNRAVVWSSIVTDWNLVCGDKYIANFSQTVMMGGVMLGSLFLGLASDKYGRKKIVIFSIVTSAIFSGFGAIISSFWSFLIFRFLLGLTVGGIAVATTVLDIEVAGNKWRAVVSNTYESFVGIGYMTMAGLAYVFRDWRELQLSFTFFNICCISYIFLIDESPRWLMSSGNKYKTKKILDKISKINGTKSLVALEELDSTDIHKEEKLGLKSLLRTPRLRKYTITLGLSWFLMGVVFLGLGQYIGQATEDIYAAVAISGAFMIPGNFISAALVKLYGRRRIVLLSSMVIPFGFLTLLYFTTTWIKILFYGLNFTVMGIFAASFHLLTQEIYPTVIRNSGVGFSMTAERVGAMIAPLLLSQTLFNPIWIFIFLAIWQPILIYQLSETYEINLYETIEDLEQLTPN